MWEDVKGCVEAAQGAYAGARRAALERERPWSLEPTLEKMEAVASAYGGPVAGRVLDAAPAVFAEIESREDENENLCWCNRRDRRCPATALRGSQSQSLPVGFWRCVRVRES